MLLSIAAAIAVLLIIDAVAFDGRNRQAAWREAADTGQSVQLLCEPHDTLYWSELIVLAFLTPVPRHAFRRVSRMWRIHTSSSPLIS
jgi:hypothetical protein